MFCQNLRNLKTGILIVGFGLTVVLYIVSGWSHNLLPESESSGLLSIPSGCWCPDLHVEGQCDSKGDCGLCDIGLEFLGCISIHEYSCQPKTEGSCPLPCSSHVRICWFSHNCH